MAKELTLYNPNDESVVVYQSEDGALQLDVQLMEESAWLTQQQMAELFQKDRSVITRHVNNIFAEGELDEKSNVHFLHFPFSDKPTKIYNLDVIISVGYRVKSAKKTFIPHLIKAIAPRRTYTIMDTSSMVYVV